MATTTRNQPRDKPGLFPALLKFWRGRRGMSQLDLALAADVSARHVSFLETGRARPSEEMALRLGEALTLPLREQNDMLRAAGFEATFAEPDLAAGLGGPIGRALERMMVQHEPYPMVAMDRLYNAVRLNRGASALLGSLVAEPAALAEATADGAPLNVLVAMFDPRLARTFLLDWQATAHTVLSRLHREVLIHPGDEARAELLDRLLAFPDVPRGFRQPDLSGHSQPVLTIRVRLGGEQLSFLTTMTRFSAPQNVTLEELVVESYFPLDEATEHACAARADG